MKFVCFIVKLYRRWKYLIQLSTLNDDLLQIDYSSKDVIMETIEESKPQELDIGWYEFSIVSLIFTFQSRGITTVKN